MSCTFYLDLGDDRNSFLCYEYIVLICISLQLVLERGPPGNYCHYYILNNIIAVITFNYCVPVLNFVLKGESTGA